MKVYIVDMANMDYSTIQGVYADKVRAECHAAALTAKLAEMKAEEPPMCTPEWDRHFEKWSEIIDYDVASMKEYDVIE